MEDSVPYQAIVRRGEAKGEAMDRIREARRLLLRLGERRFGPPTREVVAAIEAITDLAVAEALADRLLDVSSWEELVAPHEGPGSRHPT